MGFCAFVGCGGKHIVGGVERWVGMDGVFWIGWRDRNARWKGVCGRRRPTQSKGWITWRIEVGVAAVRKPVACAFTSIRLEGLPKGFGRGEPIVGFGFKGFLDGKVDAFGDIAIRSDSAKGGDFFGHDADGQQFNEADAV